MVLNHLLPLSSVSIVARVFSQPPLLARVCDFITPQVLPAHVAHAYTLQPEPPPSPPPEDIRSAPPESSESASPEREHMDTCIREWIASQDLTSTRISDLFAHL